MVERLQVRIVKKDDALHNKTGYIHSYIPNKAGHSRGASYDPDVIHGYGPDKVEHSQRAKDDGYSYPDAIIVIGKYFYAVSIQYLEVIDGE